MSNKKLTKAKKKLDRRQKSFNHKDMTKSEILEKIARLGKSREWLAKEAGYSVDTVINSLGPSKELSKRMKTAFERVILEEERRATVDITQPGATVWDLVLFTGEEVRKITEAQKAAGYSKVEDLYHDAVIDFCDGLIAENHVYDLEVKPQRIAEPNIMAAAGPGIMAELIDWNGDSDDVKVKICGESMKPLFEDGQIVVMKHKRCSRSPFLKKGLVYLVQLEGDWMVKRYFTRRPTEEEKGADYLTSSGMVGILRSENPAFDDIPIKGPFDWWAWFNQ